MKNRTFLAAAALAVASLTATSHVFAQAPAPAQDSETMRSRPLDPDFRIGKQLNSSHQCDSEIGDGIARDSNLGQQA
ncbi:hypothetical protein [Herbaspirillum seropedicae]|uniref:hypothetical protein n=1 Tax=Herbaspirillum seropedicae TaxID=964 RepID=UPI000848021E|nr:hypothetical protein [Herbaspirillum seropedicae]AON53147.1 hypothetical protein Hsc_0843 [Herbaspirillum seropedicae]